MSEADADDCVRLTGLMRLGGDEGLRGNGKLVSN